MDIDDLKVGETYSGQLRHLSPTRLLAFSGGALATPGWPIKNLHTDATMAAAAGLPAPIASGIQCEGDIVRLLLDLFGEAWFRGGIIQVKYVRPVFAGTSVQPCARVRTLQTSSAADSVELDVWCETPDKEIVVTGTAKWIRHAAD